MSKHDSIAKLLQDEPLYRKIEVDEVYFHPTHIDNVTFQFYCENESSLQTFKLNLAPEKAVKNLGRLDYREFGNLFEPFIKDGSEINAINYYVGTCQYCENYKVHFLLHLFSEGDLTGVRFADTLGEPTSSVAPREKEPKNSNYKLYLKKLGQWPAFQIKPDATLYKFLDREDKDYYNKALICISQNYGIGAFAYFRKIVEKEVVRLIEEIVKNDGSGNHKEIKALLEDYKIKKQTGPLIEKLYAFLPNGLKLLGENPFKLLYSYLSEGMHGHNDEECLKRAVAIDQLLQFTINKIREDQTSLKHIKQVLKNLNENDTEQ